MKLNLEYSRINEKELYQKEFQKKVKDIHEKLHSPDCSAGTTWVEWPITYDKKEFAKVQKLARDISKNSDALLVIGIGGSYLGAKAGIDMLCKKSKVEVVFAGITFD